LASFVCCLRKYCIFFFQAEDGIRDRNVTGVQTCALPICALPERPDEVEDRLLRHRLERRGDVGVRLRHLAALVPWRAEQLDEARSEERRVGKECRCRGWAWDLKKTEVTSDDWRCRRQKSI